MHTEIIKYNHVSFVYKNLTKVGGELLFFLKYVSRRFLLVSRNRAGAGPAGKPWVNRAQGGSRSLTQTPNSGQMITEKHLSLLNICLKCSPIQNNWFICGRVCCVFVYLISRRYIFSCAHHAVLLYISLFATGGTGLTEPCDGLLPNVGMHVCLCFPRVCSSMSAPELWSWKSCVSLLEFVYVCVCLCLCVWEKKKAGIEAQRTKAALITLECH